MNKIGYALAAGAAITLLAGCGVDHGTVIGKSYSAPYTYVSTTVVSSGNTVTVIPTVIAVPECFGLYLRDGVGEDADEGSVCVDQQTFSLVPLGAQYGAA